MQTIKMWVRDFLAPQCARDCLKAALEPVVGTPLVFKEVKGSIRVTIEYGEELRLLMVEAEKTLASELAKQNMTLGKDVLVW